METLWTDYEHLFLKSTSIFASRFSWKETHQSVSCVSLSGSEIRFQLLCVHESPINTEEKKNSDVRNASTSGTKLQSILWSWIKMVHISCRVCSVSSTSKCSLCGWMIRLHPQMGETSSLPRRSLRSTWKSFEQKNAHMSTLKTDAESASTVATVANLYSN